MLFDMTKMERRLATWEQAGLIDADTRQRIATYERQQQRPIAAYAIGVLGAATVTLGVVSIVASNWEEISPDVKLGLDLVLGAALAAGTYLSVQRERLWASEILITLLYGFTLASLALVGQIYQLGTPTYQALLLWSGATLPLLVLARSRYVAALFWIGLATTHGFALGEALEWMLRYLEASDRTQANLAITLIGLSPLPYVLATRIPWMVRERPDVSSTFVTLTRTALAGALLLLPMLWYADIDGDDSPSWSLLVVGLTWGAFAAALPRLDPEGSPRAHLAIRVIVGVAWLTLTLGTTFERGESELVGALLQLGFLALFAWSAFERGGVRTFHVCTALIALRVLIIYFEIFGSLLSTGLGLVSGGALTLGVAYVWRRQTRDLAEKLTRNREGPLDVA